MTSFQVAVFGGMVPRNSARLLPDGFAQDARNARLTSGELRGFRRPSIVHEPTLGVGEVLKGAYRAKKDDGTAVWMTFLNTDVDVVKGPLVQDAYDRYYWTGDEAFVAYLPIDEIETADPPFRLGVPAPTTAPTLVIGAGTGEVESRAYVYTFVNELGEESAPSPIVFDSGPVDAQWQLQDLEDTGTDMTDRRDLAKKRIYRTVTGESTVAYFFVAENDIVETTYDDFSLNVDVVQNAVCPSFGWGVPPDELRGLIAHPAGFLCGFVGKDIYMSEPYRPHTWPVTYVLALDHAVVGLAIYNNMLCVLTTSQPYFVAGSHPSSMAPIKNPSVEPCLSKGSIAATIQGVLYSSPNGIVLFNESGPQVVSRAILTNEEWHEYSPATIRAAQYGMQYVGFYTDKLGFKFFPSEQLAVFSEVDRFTGVQNIVTDQLTGVLWLIMNNRVWEWEPPTGDRLYYTWRSKKHDFTRPVNFGAIMVKYGDEPPVSNQEMIDAAIEYNTERILFPLNPFNYTTFNGTRQVALGAVVIDPTTGDEYIQNQYPFGGSPLIDTALVSPDDTYVHVTVYADDRVVFSQPMAPSVMRRLPSGFKAHMWEVELVGNADVFSVAVAETAKELQNV